MELRHVQHGMETRVEWNGDVITYLRWHWFFNAAQFLHSRVPADSE